MVGNDRKPKLEAKYANRRTRRALTFLFHEVFEAKHLLAKRERERSALSPCVLGEICADNAQVGQCSVLKTKLC